MNNWINFFLEPYEAYSTTLVVLEALAAFTGIISVYFATKRNIWVFPTGIFSTSIYVYLLFHFGLFGDMLINTYYAIMSIWGWYLWQKAGEETAQSFILKMNKADTRKAILLFAGTVVLVLVVYYFKPYIKGDSPSEIAQLKGIRFGCIDWVDAATTAIFFVGMWLMAARKIENWWFWMIGDFIAIPMYLVKGLGITALQYLIFLVIAYIGWTNWRRNIKNSPNQLNQ